MERREDWMLNDSSEVFPGSKSSGRLVTCWIAFNGIRCSLGEGLAKKRFAVRGTAKRVGCFCDLIDDVRLEG